MITTSLNNLPEESVSHNPEIKKKVMLRFGDLPHLTNFSQARFTPGQSAPAHAHQDMCEVFFVEAGSGVIHIDDQAYPLLPGNCVAVEPGEIHEVVSTSAPLRLCVRQIHHSHSATPSPFILSKPPCKTAI